MPTVLRFGAFRIMIFTDDHGPPHVHAIGGDERAVFLLHCAAGRVSMRSDTGLTRADIRKLSRFLEDNVVMLCESWRLVHGH